MFARSAGEAIESFLDPLQRAVSCITRSPLIDSGLQSPSGARVAFFAPRGTPVRLRGRYDLSLSVRHDYVVERVEDARNQWSVKVSSYSYVLRQTEGREIFAYHWHPVSQSPITFPHLHVGNVTTPVDLSKAHFPTGFVSLQAVLWFAIADLGVQPLRRDWLTILQEAEETLPSPQSHH